ncbi:MAG: hypothetical protein DDT31_01731 [Syntrophomonadaceae bacterium]|nr:hypothetical protein [Bacillota bacterium]
MQKARQFFSKRASLAYVGVRTLDALDVGLIQGINVIFFLERGLSFFEIAIIFGILLGTSTLLDFPTGNLADLFGRRKMYALGLFFMGCGVFIYAISHYFWLFCIGAFMQGAGTSQMSGSLSSWCVDRLISLGQKEKIGNTFANASIGFSLGAMIGGLFVGLLFKGDLWMLFVLASGINFTVAFLIMVFLEENYGDKTRGKTIAFDALRHYSKSFELILLTLLLIFLYGCYSVFVYVWQPSAIELGIPELRLGLILALHLAFDALGGGVCKRIMNLNKLFSFIGCFLLVGAGFFFNWFYGGFISFFTMIGLFSLAWGIFIPLYGTLSHQFIPSNVRASVVSLMGTITIGGAVVLQLVIGLLIDHFGLSVALLFGFLLAIFSVIIIFILWLVKGKDILESVAAND